MRHARLICNQKEKFSCTECNQLTSAGYQLIDTAETRFVCRDCYLRHRGMFPTKGKCLQHLVEHSVAMSDGYDPCAEDTESVVATTAYTGELVSDGNGGWRAPTEAELAAINAPAPVAVPNADMSDGYSTIELRYRFTSDNKLQVILPRQCKVEDYTYQLEAVTAE